VGEARLTTCCSRLGYLALIQRHYPHLGLLAGEDSHAAPTKRLNTTGWAAQKGRQKNKEAVMIAYDVEELEKEYLSTIEDNLKEVNDILIQLNISNIPIEQFEGILYQSSNRLTERWRTGRKTVRTQIARMLIPNYPKSVLHISLAIDAIINLLDDLLDEILVDEQKASYILEMVRVLALFNHLQVAPRFQTRIAEYFNKCICIGL
jgi:hypothetical protein